MDEAVYSGILDSTYAAAASYALWPEALEKMGALLGCSCVSLVDRDKYVSKSEGTAWGVDDDSKREYFAVWSLSNPLVRRKQRWQPGEIDTDRQIVSRNDLVASDYYQAFMKPRDMHAILRLTLNTGSGDSAGYHQVMNFARPVSAGDFDTSEIEIARRFMPHMQRAGQISRHLQRAQVMLDSVSNVLEQNPSGILLLDESGKVVFVNAAARRMATSDAFILRRDRIQAADRREDSALQSLIGLATGAAPAEAVRAGAIRLSRESGKAGFNAVIAPLAAAQTWVQGTPVAFMLVTDPAATPVAGEDLLAQLFGFTGAEFRIAERLLMGDSPEQAAEALDIRISTARWHLASLYRKTGTSRQAELMRLLSSLPVVVSDDGKAPL